MSIAAEINEIIPDFYQVAAGGEISFIAQNKNINVIFKT